MSKGDDQVWFAQNYGQTATTKLDPDALGKVELREQLKTAIGLLKEFEPHVDSLVCYASTVKEHPLNGTVARAQEFLKQFKDA